MTRYKIGVNFDPDICWFVALMFGIVFAILGFMFDVPPVAAVGMLTMIGAYVGGIAMDRLRRRRTGPRR